MNIKELRKKYGLSQTELAKIANTSQKTISNYESGLTEPDISTIILLANHFHTTTDNILGHEVPYLLDKSTLSTEHKELIDFILNLTPAECISAKNVLFGYFIAEDNKKQIINKFKGGN